jgi:hypothetical protein
VYALTIQTPTITDVQVIRFGTTAEQPFPYAAIRDDLVLRGRSLAGPRTSVVIDDVEVPAKYADSSRVVATIPDASIPMVGPIAPENQLQPGVRSVRILVRDPLVPQRAFTSNDAAFMLVPWVDPLLVAYSAVPRQLTLQGIRLIGTTPGGETVIGRSVVPRTSYVSATPTQIVVPLPDTLPTRGVHAVVGTVLPDPIVFGAASLKMDVNIGGNNQHLTPNLPASIPLADAADMLASLIHDADPGDPRFAGARVDLWHNGLVVVPGGLTDPVTITPVGGSPFAAMLGLAGPPLPGAASALISGVLDSPPPMSSKVPQLTITVGAKPPLTLALGKPTTLAALADDLQLKINAGAAPEYAQARVTVCGSQLLVIPGKAGLVTFDVAQGDDTTVAELQLHARFAVRVRVNGAESIGDAAIDLPQ